MENYPVKNLFEVDTSIHDNENLFWLFIGAKSDPSIVRLLQCDTTSMR